MLYDNPTELWQAKANQSGVNPVTADWSATPSGTLATQQTPSLDLYRDNTGNWHNRNASQMQAYNAQLLGNPTPQAFNPVQSQVPNAGYSPLQTIASQPQQMYQQQPQSSYQQPQLNLKQDTNGEWYNANASQMQAYVQSQLGSPVDPSTGENAAGVQAFSPEQIQQTLSGVTAESSSPYQKTINRTPEQLAADVAKNTQRQVEQISSSSSSGILDHMYGSDWKTLPADQMMQAALTAQRVLNGTAMYADMPTFSGISGSSNGAPKLSLKQDQNGDWYNENASQNQSYVASQIAEESKKQQEQNLTNFNAWQIGVKNGTVDPWAGRERVSWDEFASQPNAKAELAARGSSHVLDNIKYAGDYAGVTSQSPQWANLNLANTKNKASASSRALSGLASALQPNSNVSADTLAELLGNSGILDRSFGSDYHAGSESLNKWNSLISQALGGYDYAGELAKARSYDPKTRWQSTLRDVAEYLASPSRKLDTGALSQLAKNVGGYWGNATDSWSDSLGLANQMDATNKAMSQQGLGASDWLSQPKF